ncbi:MAG: site-specific integrase [Candidatus Nitricoxidivorans perseverans]|uniref:Site-specific integrase n=1 Tax=Candidatus Nitricoxidivorans perseverans TaxID=2975601 RepID=A0AA49FNG0_9PROT|nr:MAG: site-specific integrase [Candidatus Nitricoxidivorans perseverans]
MSIDITKPRSRSALKPQAGDAPYYRMVSDGRYLGWRPLASGGGRWVARIRHEKRYHTETLDCRGEWSDALDAANNFFNSIAGAKADRKNATVDDAVLEYLATLKADGRTDAHTDAEGRYRRTIKGSKLATIKLRELGSDQIEDWKRKLKREALKANDDDEIGANHSANRNLVFLKAALNAVFKRSTTARWINDDSAWRVVKAYPTVTRSRFVRALTVDERKAFLRIGCATRYRNDDGSEFDKYPESRKALRAFCMALMFSGCRPGAIAHMRVRDFDPVTGEVTITHDKANAGRKFVAVGRLRQVLKIASANRPGGEFMFLRPAKLSRNSKHPDTLKPWDKDSWTAAIERAAGRAGIENCTAYSFRHAAVTDLLLGKAGKPGVPIAVVAYRIGTSIRMIEKFYAHLQDGALDRIEALL